jgi:hypothetical protein
MDLQGRPDPPTEAGEKETLVGFLDFQRDGAVEDRRAHPGAARYDEAIAKARAAIADLEPDTVGE